MICEVKDLKKEHDDVIILGCGTSINLLTRVHLPWLNTVDKMATNNFVIHPFIVPDFYAVEIKPEINGSFIKTMFELKKEEYKDTILLISRENSMGGRQKALVKYIDESKHKICIYETNSGKSRDGLCSPDPDKLITSVGSSMSILIDLAVKLQYKTVYFLGVDMYSSEYFWTDNTYYKDIDTSGIEFNYCTVPTRRKADEHMTAKSMLPFLKGFIEYNHINAINLSPDSYLAEFMPTMEIPL